LTFKTWLLFLVMETALSLSPGPAVFYVVSQGVRGALRRALPAAAGIISANAIYFTLSATSLGAIIAASDCARAGAQSKDRLSNRELYPRSRNPIQQAQDVLYTFIRRDSDGVKRDLRRFGSLVLAVDAGKVLQLPAPRFGVEALRVAHFALFQRRVDIDFDELSLGEGFARHSALRPERRNERHDHDKAGIDHEFRHLRHPADVFVAVDVALATANPPPKAAAARTMAPTTGSHGRRLRTGGRVESGWTLGAKGACGCWSNVGSVMAGLPKGVGPAGDPWA